MILRDAILLDSLRLRAMFTIWADSISRSAMLVRGDGFVPMTVSPAEEPRFDVTVLSLMEVGCRTDGSAVDPER